MNKHLLKKQNNTFTKGKFWTKTLATLLFLTMLSVTKTQAQNPDLKWAKAMGGAFSDDSKSVVVDAAGNIYTTGSFQDTVDFDPNAGVFNLTSAGSFDIFVSKLDATGNLVWAKAMGGTSAEIAYKISLDATGNVYTAGYFSDTADFDPNIGDSNLTSAGSTDIFISKLDASGNFVWAKKMGGLSTDLAFSIFTDTAGNVYTTGYFQGIADFDPSTSVLNLTSNGGSYDIFVSKLDTSGNLVWAKAMGSTGNDIGYDVSADAAGNVHTTGYFNGTVDFDPNIGVSNLTSSGGQDIFVSKLDASGNLVWAKKMGGGTGDLGLSIIVDNAGNVYTTGYFQGTADFDPNAAVSSLTASGSADIFISKLDTTGNIVWAKAMGGTLTDIGYDVDVDATGNVYTTGYFQGTADFNPSAGITNLTTAGGQDIFVSKLDVAGNLVWAKAIGGSSNDVGNGIRVDASGNVYTTGYFQGTVDFDPNSGTSNITSVGGQDIFVHKMNVAGAALNFDGINDRVTIPTQPLSNLTNFTIEAWVYSTNTSSYQTIYAEGNTLDNNPMFSLTKMAGTTGFEIVLRNSSSVGLVVSSTAGLVPLNTWTHVAFSRTSATEARLYINGLNTDYFVFANPGSIAVNSANIGVRQRVSFDGFFNGSIDEVRIWNRALPQAEIANNIYCELAAGQTGLVSYYKFNQGIDSVNNSGNTTLIDASGNSNTGTLTNFSLTSTTSNWVAPGGVNTGSTCGTFLSTSNFDFSSKISVYPNPSRNVFSINSDASGTFVIYDIMGKIIKTESLSLGTTKLDLSKYPSGIYLFKVTNDSNQTKIMKLIKQ
ncbi:LamG-like jellyroll fold domain-containing protein [Flavobacterium sp.]|uniref:LamG-like jellyroll fold domain-containing protein n=1 Tax=Flavobacterium sp. TaxID=239 RepID=UPI00286DCDD9|nr:LamG-like jellyroll fold domain-containing protein [Flavobacterium sp.]